MYFRKLNLFKKPINIGIRYSDFIYCSNCRGGFALKMAIRAPHPPLTGLYSASSLTSSSLQASSYRLVDIKKPLQSSFFNGGVGSLKLGLRIVHSDRCRFRRDFVVRANLFARFTRVIKSYINAVLGSFEDPEKILEQSVLEMNADLIKMQKGTAQVLASQKGLENQYEAAQQASKDWYGKAQLALEKGDEELALEALKRRKSYADKATTLRIQLDQQKGFVENLVSNTRLLESKIQGARLKKDTLKARAQSAKTATQVSEMLGSVNTSSALSAFEKMEEKVMAMEFQAEALNQLTTDDLKGKFAYLEGSSVDDDLTSLKKELSGSSQKIELPAVGNTKHLFQDSDIEKELTPSFQQLEKDFIPFKTRLIDREGTHSGLE